MSDRAWLFQFFDHLFAGCSENLENTVVEKECGDDKMIIHVEVFMSLNSERFGYCPYDEGRMCEERFCNGKNRNRF